MRHLAEELRANLSVESLILPNDRQYESARRIWNGMADKRPAAVVRVKDFDEVRTAIATARIRNVPLAVRCGGHSLPGFSSCDGGVVIDLSRLNHIEVDPATHTAQVSGGALLGDLDKAGVRHGLVVPAGVVSHTGVAGLTLGGGMGWLSRRYGLTIDSLLGVDLVTADGVLIKTNSESEPELFWGLRGGGGNFGVATKFYFRMHELGDATAGKWTYDLSESRAALLRLADIAASAPRELTASFNLTAAGLTATAFHSGEASRGAGLVSPFGDLAGTGDGNCGPTDFLAFQSRSDEHARWGRRYYAKGGYLAALTGEAIDCMLSSMSSSPSPDSEIYVLQLGGAIGDASEAATAYTGRAAQYYWIVQPIWDDAAQDSACLAWGRETASRLVSLSMEGNYVNEQADSGSALAAKAYGVEKYRRLQRLKARFDPDNLFRLNQNVVPQA
jgi:FAD/FMN-containing dehydrogenase